MLVSLFRRTSCPLPGPGQRGNCVRSHHFLPLVGFLVPTVAIGYGIVLPHNGVTGVNELTVGFGTTLIGAAVTYVIGVLAALRR
jgi:ABC-type Fe3+ transport system permease subunit